MVIRVATFNTALSRSERGALATALARADDAQVMAVARVMRSVRADIILLNEFDYDATGLSVRHFLELYLRREDDLASLDYPYFYVAPVNTGQPSGRDFNKDGIADDLAGDALGYGFFPGQYGMLLLSRFPLDVTKTRTFRRFLWRDMPQARLPHNSDGSPWYDPVDLTCLPLSSKSHWDLVVELAGKPVHLLCSHPTPPVFDGAERRNACRNHDEIRFWGDYISAQTYMYDDQGVSGGLAKDAAFIVLGDLNASVSEGDAFVSGIAGLIEHPLVNASCTPSHTLHSADKQHTATWGVRADYVLPSKHFDIVASKVVWPTAGEPLFSAVEAASDHRLVYLDFEL